MTNTAVIDYGMGNLASVHGVLRALGAVSFTARSPQDLAAADRIVIPGVGAFAAAMANLSSGGWVEALRTTVLERRKPLLGICLGMQLLATRGEEVEPTAGLGFIAGTVRHLRDLGCTRRVPHVGWNSLVLKPEDPLGAGIPSGSDFYFVHSYAFAPEHPSATVATTDYGVELVAAVRHEHIWGVQFHPEKSSRAGRRLLDNFLRTPSPAC